MRNQFDRTSLDAPQIYSQRESVHSMPMDLPCSFPSPTGNGTQDGRPCAAARQLCFQQHKGGKCCGHCTEHTVWSISDGHASEWQGALGWLGLFDQLVCIVQPLQNDELGCLQQLAATNELIQNAVHFVEIEDQVQFTNLQNPCSALKCRSSSTGQGGWRASQPH